MRALPWTHLNRWRVAGDAHTTGGAFKIPHHSTNVTLLVVSSAGFGWEHVSVSLANRTPNWREMEFVCRLFWTEDEAVMQLHPPLSKWISNHPHCLHLWRPIAASIPMPPGWMVGAKSVGEIKPGYRAALIEGQREAERQMRAMAP